MGRNLRAWVAVSIAVSAGLLVAGLRLRQAAAPNSLLPDPSALVLGGGVALSLIAGLTLLLAPFLGARLARALDLDGPAPARVTARPYTSLFLVSFVALFVEVMLIRYAGSQIRVFAFYKNVPLVASYLGLGLGCWLGAGRARHALLFGLWLLPLAALLSVGAFVAGDPLGQAAALGSSEHILGEAIVAEPSAAAVLAGQAVMGLFCAALLVAVALLFALLGRLLGAAFEQAPRIPAYTANILGSLVGILGFVALSFLETPPWVWFAVGLAPLAWWLRGRAQLIVGAALLAACAAAVTPSQGETVWSRYQKLVGHHVATRPGGEADAYLVQISDVFYQMAMDLRPDKLAQLPRDPFPHYREMFSALRPGAAVLVVGAGTGNDVAAALRAGVARVDAVEIDPAIIAMGRANHPERPYDDARVRVIVDDARAAFRVLPAASYDAVVFGLLDSHTQLAMSSVRLDNYVFTLESLREAAHLLRPDGQLIISAATFRPWFRARFEEMMRATCGEQVVVRAHGVWTTLRCVPDQRSAAPEASARATLPTDDWPFLYLPRRTVPQAYVIAVLLLLLASVLLLRAHGVALRVMTPLHGHMFFLGAAFLLMEVHAVNRLALLFGTTWLVSAVTIALVLCLIVAANLTVAALGRLRGWFAYAGLVVSLLLSFAVSPSLVVGAGLGLELTYGLLLLLPVYFAGIIFARSFRAAPQAGPALGANMLGAVLGAWIEYSSMAVGFRALVLLALAFYLLSLLAARRAPELQRRPS